MARFLKIFSGLYLVLVWFAFILAILAADARTPAEIASAESSPRGDPESV
jgi:uncharacterized membrane protein